MGLLASIFGHLSAVAAIIVFFPMSAGALLYHPHHHATNPRSALITATNVGPHKPSKATPPKRTTDTGAIPQTAAAAEYRRKADLSNTRFEERHQCALRKEQEASEWALCGTHATAPLALGYAEEPTPPRVGDERWR